MMVIPVTPETRQAVRDAARALEADGFTVRPFRPQALEEARQFWWKFFVRCGAMLLEPLVHRTEIAAEPHFSGFSLDRPPSNRRCPRGTAFSVDGMRSRAPKTASRDGAFPILLCPVCAIPAFRHGERVWEVEGQRVEYLDAMRYTQWFNLLGSPAAVVPVGVRQKVCRSGCKLQVAPLKMSEFWELLLW